MTVHYNSLSKEERVFAMVPLREKSRKIDRKRMQTSASMLGLAAGAIGWSGLANAASEETHARIMLLPDHYELSDGNVVVFKLETGEELTLNPDQYLIMQDGLLLITDELAQASIQSLPVMGSVRSKLLRDLSEIPTSSESKVALATPEQARLILDGDAPRLFDEVSIERFELAQAVSSEEDEGNSGAMTAGGATIIGGLIAAGIFGRDNPPEEPEPEPVPAPAPAPAIITVPWDPNASPGVMPQPLNNYISFDFANGIAPVTSVTLTGAQGLALSPATSSGILTWSNAVQNSGITSWTAQKSPVVSILATSSNGATAVESIQLVGQLILSDNDVASSASFNITGSDAADYLGVDSANPIVESRLADVATKPYGSPTTPTVNIDLGDGDNHFYAEKIVDGGGVLNYRGGRDNDTIDISPNAGRSEYGEATFDMRLGGDNVFTMDQPGSSAAIVYIGGPGNDNLILGQSAGYHAGADPNEITLTPGALRMGVELQMQAGGDNTVVFGTNAASSYGRVEYFGGKGKDSVTFGDNAGNDGGLIRIDLGDDDQADEIVFVDSVSEDTDTSVTIQNFDLNDGDSITFQILTAATHLEVTQNGTAVTLSSTAGAPQTEIELTLIDANSSEIINAISVTNNELTIG